MLDKPLDIFHFFLFIIPGFITVWSFRHFTGSKKEGDFEYFALSAFWGLFALFVYELTATKEKIVGLIENPYAAGFALSILGFILGWTGSLLSTPLSSLEKRIENFLKRFFAISHAGNRDLKSDGLGSDEDWEGNNAAFKCPRCGKVFIVSAQIHQGERRCPWCDKSTGYCSVEGRKGGGSARIEWE